MRSPQTYQKLDSLQSTDPLSGSSINSRAFGEFPLYYRVRADPTFTPPSCSDNKWQGLRAEHSVHTNTHDSAVQNNGDADGYNSVDSPQCLLLCYYCDTGNDHYTAKFLQTQFLLQQRWCLVLFASVIALLISELKLNPPFVRTMSALSPLINKLKTVETFKCRYERINEPNDK